MLAVATVDYAVGSQNISHHDQNWNAALAAAEAGIDDYIFRLNENGNYWQYNAGNLPPDGNKAFIQYVPVAGGDDQLEVPLRRRHVDDRGERHRRPHVDRSAWAIPRGPSA